MRSIRQGPRLWVGGYLFLLLANSALAQTPQIRQKSRELALEERILERVNAERRREGLNPLLIESTLGEVAQSHSADMLEHRFFDHINPKGQGPSERVSQTHRTLVGDVAENIWQGIRSRDLAVETMAGEIMDGLMASPGHRRNIMNPKMTHIGLGVYSSLGRPVMTTEFMVTQVFASVRGYTVEPVPETLDRNQIVRFELRFPTEDHARVRYFDLWSSERGEPVIDPTNIGRGVIKAPPGNYQVRFLFDTDRRGRLDAVSGPFVTLR